MQKREREAGPDLVRVFAAFFVTAVHFYLNCKYYETPLVGTKMMAMTWGRWFFMICVPLFMMLTGYFKCRKTFTREHYLGLVPILITYVLIAILKVVVSNIYYGAGYYTPLSAIKAIASYQMAWYVGMYVALMLLIPFLNKLWEALDEKGHRRLIVILAIVGSLYPLVLYVVPGYWQTLYPFVFYYLGVYIRKYRPKVKKVLAVLVILAATTVEAAISFFFAKGGVFNREILTQVDSGYSVLTVVIASAAFFLFFYDIRIKSWPVKRFLGAISSVSLEIYLFTGIFDVIIFTYLERYLKQVKNIPAPNAHDYFWYFFLTVPLNFVLSVGAGLLLKLVLSPLMKKIKLSASAVSEKKGEEKQQ